jgi:hypothetical protein
MTGLAALVGMLALGWLTLFQLMLAAGLPLGRMAWGGAHRVLPGRLRLASAASALLTLLGALTVAQAGGFLALFPASWITPALWGFACIFALSVMANLFGATGIERLHGVPIALLCAASAAILALA